MIMEKIILIFRVWGLKDCTVLGFGFVLSGFGLQGCSVLGQRASGLLPENRAAFFSPKDCRLKEKREKREKHRTPEANILEYFIFLEYLGIF